MEDLTFASACEIARRIRAREVSTLEVVDAHLRRTEEVNPRLCAIVRSTAEQARDAARAGDARLAAGEPAGALEGVPFTVKDWIETEGVPCAAGIEERRDYRPKRDATVVARLRAAGAVLLGKTKPGNDNAVYPRPHNPYDLSRSPGGSSGGEAAIIAAGGSPFGIGSDSGGSLRFPAHACGIATVKPTAGLVPVTGHFPRIGALHDPRTQIGPLARHVDDLALVLPLIAGVDWRDPAVIPMPIADHRDVDARSLRVAYYTRFDGATPTPETAQAIESCAAILRDKGAAVDEAVPPRIEEALSITRAYWRRTQSYSWSEWRPSRAPVMSAEEIERSIFEWDRLRRAMLSWMEHRHVVLSPVAPHPAPRLGDEAEGDFIYTLPYSLTGWPCVVVRAGTSPEGLPMGVQVAARPWHDATALAVARVVEQATGGWQRPLL